MENPLSQNLLFLVMADISAIGPQRVKVSPSTNHNPKYNFILR